MPRKKPVKITKDGDGLHVAMEKDLSLYEKVHAVQEIAAKLGLRSKAFHYGRGISVAVKFELAQSRLPRVVNMTKNREKDDPYDWEKVFDDR